MTTPYRTPGERDVEAAPVKPSKWQKMPVLPFANYAGRPCPYCRVPSPFGPNHPEYSPVKSKGCSPYRRRGWFWNPCDIANVHRHYRCTGCGMCWIVPMPEPETAT